MPREAKTERRAAKAVTYASKYLLMHRKRRETRVTQALLDAGFEISTDGLCEAFVPMFQIATPIFIDARAEGQSLWDMLPEVKRELSWARLLPDAVFFEFFTLLVKARFDWEKRPLPPFFNYDQYSSLVLELIRFRKAVGDCPQDDGLTSSDYVSWILTDAVFYNELAGGWYEDEDEEANEEEAEEPDELDELVPPMQNMTMEPHNEKSADNIEEKFEAMDLAQ
ncbi:hypothetical protein F5Y14DRAFT_445764 [Nemania sp. NC0429]|nr:hypothetical protein F5Y14DRAFT_445764 [Nemania sp. NC0429]